MISFDSLSNDEVTNMRLMGYRALLDRQAQFVLLVDNASSASDFRYSRVGLHDDSFRVWSRLFFVDDVDDGGIAEHSVDPAILLKAGVGAIKHDSLSSHR